MVSPQARVALPASSVKDSKSRLRCKELVGIAIITIFILDDIANYPDHTRIVLLMG